MERYTQGWCRSRDGTRLWYDVRGPARPSEPDLVLCDGIGCDGFVWKYVQPYFADRHRVVRWHYRGHGRSAIPVDLARLAVPDLVDDLLAVLAAAGSHRPILAGHSVGVQVLLEAHRRAPERVRALVPVCGAYGRPLDTFHDAPHLGRSFPYLYRLTTLFRGETLSLWRALLPSRAAWALAYLAGEVNRSLIRFEDLEPYFSHLSRMDPDVFVRMLDRVSRHTAEGHLPFVDVPTLVIGAERDTFTPEWISRRMASSIPDAELLVVPRGSHAAPIEQPDLVCLRMEKFFRERLGCYRGRSSSPSAPAGGLSASERSAPPPSPEVAAGSALAGTAR